MHYNNFDHLFLEIVNDHIHFAGEITIIDLLSFSRQSRQVLEENIRVTRNSTKQLSHLQLGGKPVIRKAMNRINRVASAVAQQHLPRILNEMMETVKKKLKMEEYVRDHYSSSNKQLREFVYSKEGWFCWCFFKKLFYCRSHGLWKIVFSLATEKSQNFAQPVRLRCAPCALIYRMSIYNIWYLQCSNVQSIGSRFLCIWRDSWCGWRRNQLTHK